MTDLTTPVAKTTPELTSIEHEGEVTVYEADAEDIDLVSQWITIDAQHAINMEEIR